VFKLSCDHNLLCAFSCGFPAHTFNLSFSPDVATNLAHVFFPFSFVSVSVSVSVSVLFCYLFNLFIYVAH